MTWYNRIITIKRAVMARAGQRKIAVMVVKKLDMVCLWTDSRETGHGSMSVAF